PINGARDTVAAPIMGKGYIEIETNREQAARYGISLEDVQNVIEMALAGRAVTYTVENRDRFPVRIRYARADRNDEESIRRLLVSARGMTTSPGGGVPGGGMSAGSASNTEESSTTKGSTEHAAAPAHAAKRSALIPLSAMADVRIVEG